MARFRISRYPLRRRRRLSGSRIRLLKFSATLLSVITTRHLYQIPETPVSILKLTEYRAVFKLPCFMAK
jgi:hypothetical protein